MLKYLVQLSIDLTMMGLVTGMIFSYFNFRFGKRARRFLLVSAGVGVVCAAVIAILKNTNRSISTVAWNVFTLYIIGAFLLSFVLLLVFSVNPLRSRLKAAGEYLYYSAAALAIVTLFAYYLPDVMAYPANFNLQGKSVVSTDFLYRILGWILGLILAALFGVAAYKVVKQLKCKLAVPAILLSLGFIGGALAGKAVQLMVTRRIIKQTHFLFEIIKFTNNNLKFFIFAVMVIAAAVAVCKLVANLKVREEYANPAQHRKIRARMRTHRRWAAALLAFLLAATALLTFGDAYINRKPELSPVESCDMDDENMYVPFEQVSDGHLHRFAYFTDDDIEVRFIVIKKPNSSSYGVGLDACDICGEAGYFERGGQVVCKKCDVVMNINTIGFKGGCNPIVIDYSIADGKIIVPIEELVKNKHEFK